MAQDSHRENHSAAAAGESAYDASRLRQWLAGPSPEVSRRRVLGALTLTVPSLIVAPGRQAHAQDPPIVKPLPPELFVVHGTNAEMRWEAMRDQGFHVPNDRFFVRNHTRTPMIEPAAWRLELFGSGLREAPPAGCPVTFGLDELLRMPAHSLTAYVECAGNGRSFYDTQQGTPAEGTPWRLGAAGVAAWRGVRLSTVLERAGLSDAAVDVMPQGLDPRVLSDEGVDLGHVRRPLPIAKALDDVLLAYEMNGTELPPDHGGPVRLVVPSWVGIASIKWVGRIEVSAEPLFSPWNTEMYRMFGPSYPPEGGPPLTRQVVKSAFELAWDAELRSGRVHVLRGRSWSGGGPIVRVEVSVDGGTTWQLARLNDTPAPYAWRRWEIEWRPRTPGPHHLLARATDADGATQPGTSPFNQFGYLFGAVVRHPVRVT